MQSTLRTFIAFKLPEDVLESLKILQDMLRKTGLNLRWVPVANIHLTLKFLGDITAGDADRVATLIQAVSTSHPVLSLAAKGLGAFPTVKKARVIWTGIHGEVEQLNNLQRALDKALVGLGFEKENRPFRGHLTLARVKGRAEERKLARAVTELGTFSSPRFAADRLILFKSDLKPSGAVYTELMGAGLTRFSGRKEGWAESYCLLSTHANIEIA